MTTPVTQISLPLAADAAVSSAKQIQSGNEEAVSLEVKGVSLPVMRIALATLVPEQIAAALLARFGKNMGRFFESAPALLDLSRLSPQIEAADWAAVREQLAAASLQLIGIYAGNAALESSARQAGLAVIEDIALPAARSRADKPEAAAAVEPASSPAVVPALPAATVIDRPLRSGQRVYARGGDLVVLAMVSAGAEVIADGNIHIYAPLRGRALAGAQGDTEARIFTTSFEAELVSIAGVYRTFETPEHYADLAQQPVQVSLVSDAGVPAAEARLQVRALSIR